MDFHATVELCGKPAARAAFDKLSYSHKQQHVLAIKDAKTDETRQRRIAKSVQMLRGLSGTVDG